MENIVTSVVSNVGRYLAGPAIREVQYFLCANNVINDVEDEKEALKSERDSLLTRVEQAKERTEVVEEPVEKWLNDVENLLKEVEDLGQRRDIDNNCFQGWCPTWRRYLLCKQMVEKIAAMGEFKGKSNNIEPFSHRAPLPGIQYQSSEDFIYFESTKEAYDQLLETLLDDSIYMIGVYGIGGSGKTTLVTEVGKKVDGMNMFDKVISITVSRTPNIRGIQGKMADILNLKLEEESEEGRAQRLWLKLREKKRILVIVEDLWRKFNLMDIGIRLDNFNRKTWKIVVTTRTSQPVCTLMNCQKKIHLGLLSEEESWTLFQKLANIDDEFSKSLDGVPQKVCNECKGLPISIKTVASSLKEKHNTQWELALTKLRVSEAFDDQEGGIRAALSCLKLSYDYLQNIEAKLLFLMCSMFPEDYHIPIEDLMRYGVGLDVGGSSSSLQSMRNLIQANINELLDSGLLMHGCVKMHDMVRDAALWIAKRSDDYKILVNVDKPVDDRISDCFAISSWWYNEKPIFRQWHAPNLKMLLLNINATSSWNSCDLSHLTFEGVEDLMVFSVTIHYYTFKAVPLLLPPSIQLLTNVRTLRLNGLKLGNISFIASLTRLEVLDLRYCDFNELPDKVGKLGSLKLIDLSFCHIFEKNYNGAIGKCLQLEELYASACYPKEYVHKIMLDIGALPKLQRIVLNESIITEKRRVLLRVENFKISKLRASEDNIFQKVEDVTLEGLHERCKNIIPDMVGVVGDINDVTTIHLIDCPEIECICDTTSDSKVDDLIPRLVELRLQSMRNLKKLCRGSPQQVLRYFEKLEIIDISYCLKLQNIFPRECNLGNLKFLSLSECRGEVLFPTSVAQSLLQLEKLIVGDSSELRHIIASGRDHSFNASAEIVPAPRKSHFLMPCLREVNIYDCWRLESIFPICYVKGLEQLKKIELSNVPWLKYVFGECHDEHHSSHQHQNHIMFLHLDTLELRDLRNLVGMCPEHYDVKCLYQSLRMLTLEFCPKLAPSWIGLMGGSESDQRQHSLNENLPSKLQELDLLGLSQLKFISWVGPTPGQIWSLQCLQRLQVSDCGNLKYLFSMEVYRSLPELMSLSIYDCPQLEQIVAADEELLQLPNAEVYFPKLRLIVVEDCDKLESLFPVAMVRMLPQLSTLRISDAARLEEVFRHGSGDHIINEMEIVLPNLTEIELSCLPSFVDICQGRKLHAVKLELLHISECPKISPSLRSIQDILDA